MLRFARAKKERSARHAPKRQGAVIVLAALLMVVMIGMLAFSVDLGYILNMQTEMDRAIDAAALAGAGGLVDGTEVAEANVNEYLARNPIGESADGHGNLSEMVSQFQSNYGQDIETEVGHWDPDAPNPNGGQGVLNPTNYRPSAIRVSFERNDRPFFFGRMFGHETFSVRGEAVASFQPREIVVVLDLSASMNDDTEFQSIDVLGRSTVESNLAQCYADLGSPTYGNGQLTVNPDWAKQQTGSGSNNDPSITTAYQYSSVHVQSNKQIKRVKLQFNNGSTQTFSNQNTYSKTYAGTGSKSGKRIYKVWVQAGTNNYTYGTNGKLHDWHSNVFNSKAKTWFGMTNGNYPYPGGGSWDSYINYCRSSSNQNADAGYRYRFGYMSLINYWLTDQYKYTDVNDLHLVSAQPITAVKDAVDMFVDYVKLIDTDDRMGLAVYDASNGDGLLELSLDSNLDLTPQTARLRQAGHYHGWTNIAGGLNKARLELENNSRDGTYRLIVLMTDGVANWNTGSGGGFYNISTAQNRLLAEAQACKAAKIKVMTISLGSGADQGIMQQVADITDGTHFNIPGGQVPAVYAEDLMDAFEKIAADRPLKLVQ